MVDGVRLLAAFTDDPLGGNPAGVWIGDRLPTDAEMLGIARDVGFSETAFLAPRSGWERTIRYFSPEAEVPFCGHATIAAGVLIGESDGPSRILMRTAAGEVTVDVRRDGQLFRATLASVDTSYQDVDEVTLDQVLAILGWEESDLDPDLPPAVAYAGAHHLVLAAASIDRLSRLEYDFDRLRALMEARGWTTIQLVQRESDGVFHSRNPFPVGGVYEDPATGAAAAALGGYLRDAGLIEPPVELLVKQGDFMGRPGRLEVSIPSSGGILVSGRAVDIPASMHEQTVGQLASGRPG